MDLGLTPKKFSAREALLTAAEKLFSERGYDEVSTRTLAETAGVNLAAIQYHFGSKAKLFVQTIEKMMQTSGCVCASFALCQPIENPVDAAQALKQFIERFLTFLFHHEGPQSYRLVIREIFSGTSQDPELYEALVSSVVTEFIKPTDDLLCKVIASISPHLSRSQVEYSAQSVIGQCAFYLTHRPFLERLRQKELSANDEFSKIIEHILAFSLRGLGCEKAVIEAVAGNAK